MSWTGVNSTVFCTSESDAWIVRFTGPVGPLSSSPVIDWYLSLQHGNNVYLVDVLDLCWLQSHLRVRIARTCPSSQRAHPSPVPRTATAALQQSSRSLGRLACVFPQRRVGSPRSSSWLAPWVPVPIQQRVVHSGGMNCVCGTRRESSDCPAPVSASPETIDAFGFRIWSVHHTVDCQNLDLNLHLKHLCCSLSGLNCPNSFAWSQ